MGLSGRQIALAGAVVVAAAGLATLLNVLSMAKLQLVAGLTIVLASLFYAQHRGVLTQLQDSIEEAQASTPDRAVTVDEARQQLQDWADDEYKDSLRFDWANAEHYTRKLPWPEDDTELIYGFYTSRGDKDTDIIVYYNATADKRLEHRRASWQDIRDNPFKYCEYVRGFERLMQLRAYQYKHSSGRGGRDGGQLPLTGGQQTADAD